MQVCLACFHWRAELQIGIKTELNLHPQTARFFYVGYNIYHPACFIIPPVRRRMNTVFSTEAAPGKGCSDRFRYVGWSLRSDGWVLSMAFNCTIYLQVYIQYVQCVCYVGLTPIEVIEIYCPAQSLLLSLRRIQLVGMLFMLIYFCIFAKEQIIDIAKQSISLRFEWNM